MLGLSAALLLQTSLIAADVNNYATAHRQMTEDNKPLVILIGADWCPGCRTMKQTVIPQAQQRGLLKNVAFAVINPDHEPALARQLMRSTAIPQLIMYRRGNGGWLRHEVIGAQSIDSVHSFLNVPEEKPTEQISKTRNSDSVAGR